MVHLKHKAMKSRLLIEVDFDTNTPIIKIISDYTSQDLRDQTVRAFAGKFSGWSSWCKISWDYVPDNSVMVIRPITPNQLQEESELMTARANELANYSGVPESLKEFAGEK